VANTQPKCKDSTHSFRFWNYQANDHMYILQTVKRQTVKNTSLLSITCPLSVCLEGIVFECNKQKVWSDVIVDETRFQTPRVTAPLNVNTLSISLYTGFISSDICPQWTGLAPSGCWTFLGVITNSTLAVRKIDARTAKQAPFNVTLKFSRRCDYTQFHTIFIICIAQAV
jgi:hypothetical protein